MVKNKSLLIKINSADNKCKDNLMRIAQDDIFLENEKLFDLILSQTSIHSQNIIYKAIKQGVSKNIMYLLMSYTDGYIKQQRILKYANYQNIFDNESILLDMLNIENEYVENKLFELLRLNKINDISTYNDKKKYFSSYAKFKGLFKKEESELSEIDYKELKQRRILKDNVLKDVKKVLRNFGFLGIDIPRLDDKNKDKNDVINSFNRNEYQKLFNVDDFGDEKLFVNGTITNAKSNNNFVELVIILKELLKKYYITNYNINIYDDDIYELIKKYSKDNINLVSDDSDIIKFSSSKGEEFTNISRVNNDIVFNIKIDKIVDYIISEKKEKNVTEDNLRDTLIYVNEEMKENKKLYNSLIDKYLYEYHAIIVYEEDISREELSNYCVRNNIKFIAFLGENDHFKMIKIEDMINGESLGTSSRKLNKILSNKGEQ